MAGEDPTTGEVMRRLDRLEVTVLRELQGIRTEFVQERVFSAVVNGLRDDLHDLAREIEDQRVTRRQILVGAFLLVLGEVLAIGLAVSNLAARMIAYP